MILSTEELKNIYFGAYSFAETDDGYLQAFQYTKEQMEYFKGAFDFWYDRCMATTAKTLEFSTDATEISLDYKIIWKGSEDTFELCVDGQITEITYVKDIPVEGSIKYQLTPGTKEIIVYLPADATVVLSAPGYTQTDNSIRVPDGTRVSYVVSKSGYMDTEGNIVVRGDIALPVDLKQARTLTVTTTPADATVVLKAEGRIITGNSITVTEGATVDIFQLPYPTIALVPDDEFVDLNIGSFLPH